MAKALRTVRHRILKTEINLLEPTSGEWGFGDGNFLGLEIDGFEDLTFDELRELAAWMIQQADELEGVAGVVDKTDKFLQENKEYYGGWSKLAAISTGKKVAEFIFKQLGFHESNTRGEGNTSQRAGG